MEHRIQNFETLAETEARRDALSIAEAGLAAIDTSAALGRRVRVENDELHIDDQAYPIGTRRIYFVGVGKCAFAAAEAIEHVLGERLAGGIALDVSPIVGYNPGKIETYVGTHPLPSEVNESATKRIMEFLADRQEDDLIIMLISGGGSTLLCLHEAPMTCLDESTLFSELTARGATIEDINTVRKHISRARGGALAKAAHPAEVIALIVSDVPGNDTEYIASGPTVLDSSTVSDARTVLAKYSIETAATVEFVETPKEEKYFKRVTNTLFLTSSDALAAMRYEAERRNYTSVVVNDAYTGEASTIGRLLAVKLHDAPPRTALLYAGESTVTLPAQHGAGGRNQEMALSALADVRDDELVLTLASDGHDNSHCAGAIADAKTRAHAEAHNLSPEEYLVGHRSYDFFAATRDALKTGYTGSNVSDLIITLKK